VCRVRCLIVRKPTERQIESTREREGDEMRSRERERERDKERMRGRERKTDRETGRGDEGEREREIVGFFESLVYW